MKTLNEYMKEKGLTSQDLPDILWESATECSRLSSYYRNLEKRRDALIKHKNDCGEEYRQVQKEITDLWQANFEVLAMDYFRSKDKNPDGEWETNQADCEGK